VCKNTGSTWAFEVQIFRTLALMVVNTFYFVSDIISEVVFGAILYHVTWPRAQLLGQSISLKFSLETRLELVF